MGIIFEKTQAALSNIRSLDPRIRAVISVLDDSALSRARSLDAQSSRQALHGALVAVKDNICTKIGATTCASHILQNYQSPFDAHVVERLHAAGAVIVAKTNLDEFAMGSSTENSAYFPTRNPWNLDCVPGGSSGGSIAAVAARLTPYALGSETGGSIRQPASFCGVCGLKPSYGRVSRYGLVAFASSLDQIGPVATDVRGLAELLGVIAGRDERDSTSVDAPVPDYAAMLDESPGRVRIGIAAEYFGDGLHPETRARVEAAIDTYRKLGAEICEIHLPHAPYTIACYYLVCTAEASSNLARFDGVRYGHRTAHPKDYFDVYSASRAEGFGSEVKRRIMLGTFALSSGYYDAYYLKALKVRTLIKQDFENAFNHCDVILSPTTPTPAFRLGEKRDNPLEMYLADIYNCAANLAGIPAVSIPCGFTSEQMPVGMQLMAPHFAEGRLLQIANWYQTVTSHHLAKPPICAD
ncbi:MAG: Asp-tRNA(Asn)/Glu-tRNA(Gln) amidotransferase subunit GatA [Phycisphaerae bacterium]|nr:Asp-tRNA(Asn)/Glu-tRNA(Gln) amidotransferase subunit GatA [Phycisphaerae bacterium]